MYEETKIKEKKNRMEVINNDLIVNFKDHYQQGIIIISD